MGGNEHLFFPVFVVPPLSSLTKSQISAWCLKFWDITYSSGSSNPTIRGFHCLVSKKLFSKWVSSSLLCRDSMKIWKYQEFSVYNRIVNSQGVLIAKIKYFIQSLEFIVFILFLNVIAQPGSSSIIIVGEKGRSYVRCLSLYSEILVVNIKYSLIQNCYISTTLIVFMGIF